MNQNVVIVGGERRIVIERGNYYTKVLTPMHDIINVRNGDIEKEVR